MLDGVTTRLVDIQKKLKEILPSDAILVGHSLNFDLHALRIFHPYVVDLSVIFNLRYCKDSCIMPLKIATHFCRVAFKVECLERSKNASYNNYKVFKTDSCITV